MLNPFGLTGWEALLTTAIVCLTVFGCVASVCSATVQCTRLICAAVDRFNESVRDAIEAVVAIFSGKAK